MTISPPRVCAVLLALVFAIGLGSCDSNRADTNEPAPGERGVASPDLAPTPAIVRVSESGEYRVEIRSENASAPRDSLHPWLVRVSTQDGSWIRPTRLAFSGGMPQHGHGFQTAPHVTDALDDGWFRVGGIRFHMAGEWMVRVEFVGPAGPDVAVFEITVPY